MGRSATTGTDDSRARESWRSGPASWFTLKVERERAGTTWPSTSSSPCSSVWKRKVSAAWASPGLYTVTHSSKPGPV